MAKTTTRNAVYTYLDDDEKKLVEDLAQKYGMSVSGLIKMLIKRFAAKVDAEANGVPNRLDEEGVETKI